MYNSLYSLARKGLQAAIFSRPLQTSARMASSGFRVERDNVGEVKVPSDRYYGAQTARYMNKLLGPSERMPISVIHALGVVKGAAAEMNKAAGRLDPKVADAIKQAANEVATGKLNEHFTLVVWSPSGKEMDINANEVISNRAIEILGGELGSKYPVHPDDHVNMCQTIVITLPPTMKIATASEVNHVLVPGLQALCDSLDTKAQEFKDLKFTTQSSLHGHGSLGEVFTAYAQRLNSCNEKLKSDWMKESDMELHSDLIKMFKILLSVATELQSVAKDLSHIVNDVFVLGSGGYRQLTLAENEPRGDTECEPPAMIISHVIWKLQALFQPLNIYGGSLSESRPLIIKNVLSSVRLLGDAAMCFSTNCVAGIKANTVV